MTDDYKPILLKPQKDQMGCVFASLLLHGDGDSPVEITSDKLINILRAAKVDPNPFFPNLYARILKTVDIKDFILSGVGGGSSGPVSTSAPTGGNATTETTTEAPKEEAKKEEVKEEESASIGGLFGSDDD